MARMGKRAGMSAAMSVVSGPSQYGQQDANTRACSCSITAGRSVSPQRVQRTCRSGS